MEPKTTLARIRKVLRESELSIGDPGARVAIESLCEEIDRLSDEMSRQGRELSESSMWTKRY